jgi:hypothetical protein
MHRNPVYLGGVWGSNAAVVEMIYLLLLIPLAVVFIASMQPRFHWTDDGDVTGIVQHSVRVPSEIERHAMWWDKAYIRYESGVQA